MMTIAKNAALWAVCGLVLVVWPASGECQTNNSNSGQNYSNSSSSSSGSTRSGGRTRSDRYGNETTDGQATRDQRDQQNTRDRNSRSTGSGAGSSGAQTGGGPRSVKPKAAAPRAAAASGNRGAQGTGVEFKIKADLNANLLAVEHITAQPTMFTNVAEGDTFGTRVVFYNSRRTPFRRIQIALKYDPKVLQPEAFDDSSLDGLLADAPKAYVDERRGVIAYDADLETSSSQQVMPLLKIQWKALARATDSPIEFLNSNDYPTRLLDGTRNVLLASEPTEDTLATERSGLLGASVAILPKDRLIETDSMDASMSGVAVAAGVAAPPEAGGVTLSLRPRQTRVSPGEEFLVDVVYNNPRRVEVDRFQLKMLFDPAVLEVVDADTDNWITQGINVLDGPYHEDFAFDMHGRNAVFNSAGEIFYDMGFMSRQRIPTSGILCTIRFRALAREPDVRVRFDFNEDENLTKTTLSFLGANMIGAPGRRAEALREARIQIY